MLIVVSKTYLISTDKFSVLNINVRRTPKGESIHWQHWAHKTQNEDK